jgi:hypothetical protein
MTNDQIYPCACCGYLVNDEPPGSCNICPICSWEDDLAQLRYPDLAGGANKVSLTDGQKNFATIGVHDATHLVHVRKPSESDRKDPEWRPVDRHLDEFELTKDPPAGADYPKDYTQLYYWRKTYWLR